MGASYSNEDNPGVDWNGLGTCPTRLPDPAFHAHESQLVFLGQAQHHGVCRCGAPPGQRLEGQVRGIGHRQRDAHAGDLSGSAIIDAGGQPLFSLGGGGYDYERTRSFDAQLSGVVTAWGRSHDVVVGASHRRSRWDDVGGGATIDGSFTLATFNPLNWDPRSVPLPVGAYGCGGARHGADQRLRYGPPGRDRCDQADPGIAPGLV
jgi:outer membrane receptor for ferric coprogen and ferric-rhodotorulic acid